MELNHLLAVLIALLNSVRADVEGQREVPQDDLFAPNSVPMLGKKGGPPHLITLPLPMLRLKKDEKESPFVYRTPWHIGKRSSSPDIYTASWIGSLFKPSSADMESKHNRRMKFLRNGSMKGGGQENIFYESNRNFRKEKCHELGLGQPDERLPGVQVQ